MYNGDDWKSICRMVSDVCFPIFPHLRKKSVRSAIMSNVFESQAERYYKSKNMNVRAKSLDSQRILERLLFQLAKRF